MQDFLNKLKHFMDDRYGVDDLSCALGALGVIIALLGALLKVGLFTWIAIIVIVLAIVRAISDKADGSSSMDYPTFEAQAARNSAALVIAMLKRQG